MALLFVTLAVSTGCVPALTSAHHTAVTSSAGFANAPIARLDRASDRHGSLAKRLVGPALPLRSLAGTVLVGTRASEPQALTSLLRAFRGCTRNRAPPASRLA